MVLYPDTDFAALNLVTGGIIPVPAVLPALWAKLPYNGGEAVLYRLTVNQQVELATERAVLVPVAHVVWSALPSGAMAYSTAGTRQNLLFVLTDE